MTLVGSINAKFDTAAVELIGGWREHEQRLYLTSSRPFPGTSSSLFGRIVELFRVTPGEEAEAAQAGYLGITGHRVEVSEWPTIYGDTIESKFFPNEDAVGKQYKRVTAPGYYDDWLASLKEERFPDEEVPAETVDKIDAWISKAEVVDLRTAMSSVIGGVVTRHSPLDRYDVPPLMFRP